MPNAHPSFLGWLLLLRIVDNFAPKNAPFGAANMSDSASTSAPPSSGSATSKSSGPLGGSIAPKTRQRLPGAFRSHFGVMLALGKRYLLRHQLLVVFYVIAYLLGHSVLPAAVGLYAQQISNGIPVAAREASSEGRASPGGAEVRPAPVQVTGNSGLWRAYGLWLAATLGVAIMGLAFSYVASALGGRVSNAIRRDLFAAILQKPSLFFHEHESQQLTMLVNQFSLQVQSALQDVLINPVLDLFGVVLLGYGLFQSLQAVQARGGNQVWLFFSVIVLIALLSPWLVSRMGSRLRQSSQSVQQQNLVLASLVGGAIGAPEEIQAMRAEEIFAQKHEAALKESLHRRLHQTLTVGSLNLLNRFPGDLVLVSLMGLSVFIAANGLAGINAGVVAGLMALTPSFMGSIQGFSALSINFNMTWPAIESVGSILCAGPAAAPSESGLDDAEIAGAIEARRLVFQYRATESRKIFDDASFVIPAGSITGLIAKAGQGKTTFFRLALRFYELSSGEILLGGISHTRFSLESLRRQIVLMPQSPAFFHDTIRENLRVARPAATDLEIQELCERTGIWSVLGEAYGQDPLDRQFASGNLLSGGQKKLFALTRCLLRKPSILLLDEPTTGIDPEDKYSLLQVMRQVCAGKTVVVVDHDIVGWQIPFCDRFIVLDRGKIVQSGAAAQLLPAPGLFRDMFERQIEGVRLMNE
ncbi:MAG TPA: ABC transporter ATP-binding protein, partial [Chthoniobacterales bacterium]|nr:ABC transporter ATP-binding protein [Chthoniobacterales bacterium]